MVEWLKEESKTKVRENEYLGVGGEDCFPFHLFEGAMPHPPKIALEICDSPGENWPEAVAEPYRDIWKDPVVWAKEIEKRYQPDILCLQLISTDPMGRDLSSEEAGEVAKAVAMATGLPLIVYGCGNVEKDAKVLKRVAEVLPKKVAIGPVVEGNYNALGATALAYGHYIIAQTPTDVNLCKQLNILLSNLGVPLDKIIIDPTPSSLGYGLEYTYSVMEKIRTACFQTGDDKLNLPIIGNIAKEVWKIKEVRVDDEKMGETKRRGIFFETITAISFILAGANIVVIRHPKSLALLRGWIAKMMGKEGLPPAPQPTVEPKKVETPKEPFDIIIQAAFTLFCNLGGGLLEEVYKNALFLELKKNSLEVKKDRGIICNNTLIMIDCQDSQNLSQHLLSLELSYGIGLSFGEALNIIYTEKD